MARQTAEAAPAPAPRGRDAGGKFTAGTSAVPAAKPSGARAAETQSTGAPVTMAWSDQEDVGFADGPAMDPAETTEAPAEDPKPVEAGSEDKTPAETPEAKEEEKAEEKKPEEPKPDPAAAEKRARVLASLEVEKVKRGLEEQVTTWRTKHDGLEAKLKGGTLAERLALIGVDKQALEDMFLTGSDELAQVPERKAQPDPDVVSLKEQVKTLTDELNQRRAAEAQQTIQRAIETVQATVKDLDAPMVKTVRDIVITTDEGKQEYIRSGYDLVLQSAHHAWLEAGKAGAPKDYIPEATKVVESFLRQKRPDLMPKAEPKLEAEEPTEPSTERRPVAIGKKTGARPDPKPDPLPLDPGDRDEIIMRRMGWRR